GVDEATVLLPGAGRSQGQARHLLLEVDDLGLGVQREIAVRRQQPLAVPAPDVRVLLAADRYRAGRRRKRRHGLAHLLRRGRNSLETVSKLFSTLFFSLSHSG